MMSVLLRGSSAQLIINNLYIQYTYNVYYIMLHVAFYNYVNVRVCTCNMQVVINAHQG